MSPATAHPARSVTECRARQPDCWRSCLTSKASIRSPIGTKRPPIHRFQKTHPIHPVLPPSHRRPASAARYTPDMHCHLSTAALLALCLLCIPAAAATAADPSLQQAIAIAKRADLRVFEGKHLVLITDCPAGPTDDLATLPGVFDQAFQAWCHHYTMDPSEHADWRALGCLIVEPERFRSCGLLPPAIPPFENGFCAGSRFWLMNQSNPSYRRHLLLHEGVHAFTITLRRLDAPPWYTEGIAELLATHRLGEDGFEPTPIPIDPADVEQLGRIEAVRTLREQHVAPSLADVFATAGSEHHRIRDYAASWAATAFLAEHPRYRKAFSAAQAGPLDGQFTQRLLAIPAFNPDDARRDFDAFTDDLDYGYDLEQMMIDWSPGEPLQEVVSRKLDPARGWQNTGVSVEQGARVRFQTRGRSELGRLPGIDVDLTSEGQGITIDWYRGRPIGRLFIAQWIADPADAGRPRFERLAEGSTGSFIAATTGPIFARINDSPAGRRDNGEGLELLLAPEPSLRRHSPP